MQTAKNINIVFGKGKDNVKHRFENTYLIDCLLELRDGGHVISEITKVKLKKVKCQTLAEQK